MDWDRNLVSNYTTLVMVVTLIFLIIKRENLGQGINYFIYAIAVGTSIEIFNAINFRINPAFNSVPVYVIGVNMIVFLLFFMYFHQVLDKGSYRTKNLIIVAIFVVWTFIAAIVTKDFFTVFPIYCHFGQVTILSASIFLLMSQIFNSDKILVLRNYFPFWICIGLMTIYLGIIPLLFISRTASHMINMNIFFIILFIVNFIGYSILIFGILSAKKQTS